MQISKTIITPFFICLLLSIFGCGLNPFSCDIKMNKKFIKNSCGLTNGVRFEKLVVIEGYEGGPPLEYIVTQRFECYNPGTQSINDFNPNKIYFDRANSSWKWSADTVSFQFRGRGSDRERVNPDSSHMEFSFQGPYDTIAKKVKGDTRESFISSKKIFDICPVSFEKNTWYRVNVFQQEISEIFVYADEKLRFKVYTYKSNLSPI